MPPNQNLEMENLKKVLQRMERRSVYIHISHFTICISLNSFKKASETLQNLKIVHFICFSIFILLVILVSECTYEPYHLLDYCYLEE